MIIPMRCFTCNNILSDKYLKYIEEVKKYKDNDKKFKQKLLEELNIKRYCCKRFFITSANLIEDI